MINLRSLERDPISYIDNTASSFWRLLDANIQPEDWCMAIQSAMGCLDGLPVGADGTPPDEVMAAIQSERQFGTDHWHLSRPKRIYYQYARQLLPSFLRVPLRTLLLSRQRNGFLLRWPIEDRYVRFQFDVMRQLLESKGRTSVPYVQFWPAGKCFALVLTHDVEGPLGQSFVPEVTALEEAYGFRSSFNFVPEGYPVDLNLLQDLKERGFEVGVHGLKHDGRLFSSKASFDKQASKINQYLKQWDAVGFRSPFTHRNPDWMQALEIEYDLSFFDSDPYEPMPGGTMSIWPFMIGHFVELPYTLSQDHTLMVTLAEQTPRVWLEKVEFIRRYHGLALVNTHPDYLRDPRHFAIYEAFLKSLSKQKDYWHALPRDAASWWRARAFVNVSKGNIAKVHQPDEEFEFTMGYIRLDDTDLIAL
jgi:peptidoglycan/xylan/chitin deacetylase (PgdA/CDA1 family)